MRRQTRLRRIAGCSGRRQELAEVRYLDATTHAVASRAGRCPPARGRGGSSDVLPGRQLHRLGVTGAGERQASAHPSPQPQPPSARSSSGVARPVRSNPHLARPPHLRRRRRGDDQARDGVGPTPTHGGVQHQPDQQNRGQVGAQQRLGRVRHHRRHSAERPAGAALLSGQEWLYDQGGGRFVKCTFRTHSSRRPGTGPDPLQRSGRL